MKQGDRFLKILMFLLAAVVLAYFGYAAYGYFSAPLTTVTALEYEADAGATVTGYVVRDEVQLTSSQPIVVPTKAEGERTGSGQTVAVAYRSSDAQQHQAEIANLQRQIRQLSYAADETVSPLTLDGDIAALLAAYTVRCTLGQATGDLGDELKGLVIRSGASGEDLEALKTEKTALEQQLAALTSQSGSGAEALTVREPGYFSGAADGYESVLTPAALETMTAADYAALPDAALPVSPEVYGKLVRSDTWYFVTILPEAQLGGAEAGDSVTLDFLRDAYAEMEMRISRIVPSEDGNVLLVLSGNRYLQDVTLLRKQSCTLTFQSYTGLRVPKEAVHVDEAGQAGVYVLEGAVARWKTVEILYETKDNYVAALDQSSTDALWPGDEIILGSNLFDGKVVDQ